jgi:predicted metal-dependent hydrolase
MSEGPTVIPGGPKGREGDPVHDRGSGSPSLASLAGDDSWPRWAHVPGTGTEPDRAPLEAAKRLVRRPVNAAAWESDDAYRYGAMLCVREFFWEAHEVWEAVWLACPPNGRERAFLRALIQIANAGLKLRMGRPKAAMRLLQEVETMLTNLDGKREWMGVDIDDLRRRVGDAITAEAIGFDRLFKPLVSIAIQRD